jgi:K+-transporting ATPase KdpF subunit
LREFEKSRNGEEMSLETILAIICAVLLAGYLIYALLRPEKF